MSKAISRAIEDVEKSQLIWLNAEHTTFQVTNAASIWNNFRGVNERYPQNHSKYFNLCLTKEQADELVKYKFSVTRKFNKDEQGNEIPSEAIYFVKVNVNFNGSYPPGITLYTPLKAGMKRTALDGDSVSILDTIRAERMDCIVHGSILTKLGHKTMTCYVNKLNVRQSEEEAQFGGYWDEIMQEEVDGASEYHGDEN